MYLFPYCHLRLQTMTSKDHVFVSINTKCQSTVTINSLVMDIPPQHFSWCHQNTYMNYQYKCKCFSSYCHLQIFLSRLSCLPAFPQRIIKLPESTQNASSHLPICIKTVTLKTGQAIQQTYLLTNDSIVSTIKVNKTVNI